MGCPEHSSMPLGRWLPANILENHVTDERVVRPTCFSRTAVAMIAQVLCTVAVRPRPLLGCPFTCCPPPTYHPCHLLRPLPYVRYPQCPDDVLRSAIVLGNNMEVNDA